jgi:DNA-binding transcriptional ArsR family regulator
MNRNNVLNYASEIPEEIKSVIKGLDSDVRIAIIVILMKDAKLTFSELKQRLSLNSSSLSSHLSALQDGGLVNNFLEW